VGKNNNFGGNTVITRNGDGWPYDECEVRDEVKSEIKTETKTTAEQIQNSRVKLKRGKTSHQLWQKYVKLTADARISGEEQKTFPIKLYLSYPKTRTFS
jgi:hypothetical protein